MGGRHIICNVETAWEAAVAVTAAAYAVAPELLRAESRGRGPRPPRKTWEARKMAVHLAVVLADCQYIDLARLLNIHKDTVCSHCASIREACAESDELEALSLALEAVARTRLILSAITGAQLRSAA